MSKKLKWIAIAIALVLGGTYAIYSLEYKGNYNLDASFTLNVDQYGNVAIAEFSYDIDETGMMQFWDQLKGRGTPEGTENYIVWWTLNQSGELTTVNANSGIIAYGESGICSIDMDNLEPGSGTLSIEITNREGTLLLTKSYEVRIG